MNRMQMSEGVTRPELPKRFYKEVSIAGMPEAGFTVLLDGRGIKTPARRALVLPSQRLAEAIAAEWRRQGERIDPATMPATRLANTVVDGVADDPWPVRDEVKRYIETDLLFYRAGHPERLVERQTVEWDPLVHWAESRIGGRFTLAEGVMHVAQPAASIAAFGGLVDAWTDPFEIAGLNQMTTLTGSALLALAVAESRLSVEEAWAAAHLEEDWNIEFWGADEEAAERRAARFEEMKVAALAAGVRAVEGKDAASS